MREINDESSWFALRIFYNKVVECRNRFVEYNEVLIGNEPAHPVHLPDGLEGGPMECYAPLYEERYTDNDGNQVVVEKAFIPSLFFLRCTRRQAEAFEVDLPFKARLYRNVRDEVYQPTRIPRKQMEMFIKVTSGSQEGLEYFDDTAFGWRKGVRVRVTGGRFEGLEGEVKRIDGNKRLIVAIEGICAVATSYIPKCFLEKIE